MKAFVRAAAVVWCSSAGVASAQTLIYQNPASSDGAYYSGQSRAEAIDDLHLLGGGEVSEVRVEYFDPDAGRAPFAAHIQLYANPTGNDDDIVPIGVPYTILGLAPGAGTAVFDLIDPPAVGSDVWLGVRFDSPTAGVRLNATPTIGSSHDLYVEGGRFYFFGGDPVANFAVQVAVVAGTVTDVPHASREGLRVEASPNPFNPHTEIRLDLPREGHLVVEILDVRGRRVRRLDDRIGSAGPVSVIWDGKNDAGRPVPSGVYHVRALLDGERRMTKVTLLK